MPFNTTHSPALTSWVASANGHADFPIQNLPVGVFQSGDKGARIGVAIGDCVLDVAACASAGLLGDDAASRACGEKRLNKLMSLGPAAASSLRRRVSDLLREGAPEQSRAESCLVAAEGIEMILPVDIGDYTDFYASIHHAANVGSMFRPDNPLLPNYKYIPIAYHGRASSIVVSGTPIRRPNGQTRDDAAQEPRFGPSRRLDYEMEVGFYIGEGNAMGEAIAIGDAARHVFGFCLVNDWSARDIQSWEYQPLGPFLAKSFATSVSPWVVTAEAIAPFRIPAPARPAGDPGPLPHLDDEPDRALGGIDLTVEVWLASETMRRQGAAPVRLSQGNFEDMYWTVAQMVAHHASGGCNLRPGDLLASGTVSGTTKESRGCLLERAWRGTEPVELPTGELRRFLEDGDEVILRGYCEREGYVRIGFGECRGVVR